MDTEEIKDTAGEAYDKYRGASDSKQKYILAAVTFVLGIIVGVLI